VKIIRKIFIWIFVSATALVATAVVIGYIYAEEAKQFVLAEINQQILAEVQVKEMDFSLLKKFPFATIEFKSIIVKEALEKADRDTLLQAGSVLLHFNLIDILKGRYNLKKIQVKDAIAKPHIDEKGRENYKLWNSEASDENLTLALSIDEVSLTNVSIQFLDLSQHHKIFISTDKSVFSGNLSAEHFTLKTALAFYATELTFDKIVYVKNQPIKIDLELDVDKLNRRYHIGKSDIAVAGLHFLADGTIEALDNGTMVNLSLSGKDISIKSLLSLLPEQYADYTKDYDSQGIFRFSGKLKGLLNEKSKPVVQADFDIANGELFHKATNIKAEQIKLNGSFDSQSGNLLLPGFFCNIGTGEFKGSLSIKNLPKPYIDLEISSSVDLAEVHALFPFDNVEKISGKMALDASFSSNFKEQKDYTAEDFRKSKSSGKLNLTAMDVQAKGNAHIYENINANLLFDNNDVIIQNFNGNYAGSDFQLEGFFRNVFSWFLIENENLIVDAKLRSKKINLNELLNVDASSSADTTYNLDFAKRASLYLTILADELEFRKFKASGISGKVVFKDQVLKVEGARFSALEGGITLSAKFDGSDGKNWNLTCNSEISNINVSSLFYQLENFGQEVMQDKHISGNASAQIQLSASFNDKLEIDKKSIHCISNLLIEQGEIKNFQPLIELSAFIKVPDFKNVKFASLQNVVEIKDEKIHLPKMDINSSAIDITISGVHSFNDNIDYRFRLLLGDILARKAKDNNKNNTEFGFVDDGDRRRMSLFIAMKGTVDHPKFSYDGVGLKEKLKQDVQAEKQTVKSILKEEFGVFKSDSSLRGPASSKTLNHKVEWEEFDEKGQPKQSKEKPKPSLEPEKKEKGRFGKWLDKVGS
jgi:hypothetical protein